MTKILIVDDSAVDRRFAGNLLEKNNDPNQDGPLSVVYADNGKKGLEAISGESPDLVLTDLQMPEMNGLELVEAAKLQYPWLPIILMTGQGSEEIASQALQAGAASYVPKRNLAQDLVETVTNVLAVAGAHKERQRLLDECWMRTESYFLLENDMSHIAPLIGHMLDNLKRMKICDENGCIRVAVALREALVNAMLHGNLEISSDLRETDEKAYYALIEQRRELEPFDDRHVHVHASETPTEARYVIRDEGPGFDLNRIPDPTDMANLERVCGRGLLLINTFMDEVKHNKKGNEITMIKRRHGSVGLV